ncbi:hypothetical protein [Alienimonas californiensis]|uniref:Uncharacterized protein n=1 Tax=Alienimonas californiensis TaxID=2527989 RepID=A0A517P5G3_9PLAN|nr:hypothetical protein [Alienimonas californiensis]QDT14596.1 hypothetical protein CA12_06710 [Alienimonas californiensis]
MPEPYVPAVDSVAEPVAEPVVDAPAEPPAPRPRWWTRCLWAAAHLALAYHLISLAIGPAAMMPPSSEVQRTILAGSQRYLRALYLEHGYHYFAPEPGPSTLLKYEGTRPDGSRVAGVIPDVDGHFPRLLYHRHFMLTERLAGPVGRSPDYQAALARGLGLETGAEELSLTVVTHRLPEIREVRAGFGLDDPATYSERPLGRFDARPLTPTEVEP